MRSSYHLTHLLFSGTPQCWKLAKKSTCSFPWQRVSSVARASKRERGSWSTCKRSRPDRVHGIISCMFSGLAKSFTPVRRIGVYKTTKSRYRVSQWVLSINSKIYLCSMTVNKAARILCLLVSLLVQMLTVNATMYYNSDTLRESSLYETASSMQIESSKTCLASGAHEVCQSAQVTESGQETAYFHVCPIDGDPCNPQKCYYSSVPLCCPNALGLNCISTSDVLVGDKITKVTFNRVSCKLL